MASYRPVVGITARQVSFGWAASADCGPASFADCLSLAIELPPQAAWLDKNLVTNCHSSPRFVAAANSIMSPVPNGNQIGRRKILPNAQQRSASGLSSPRRQLRHPGTWNNGLCRWWGLCRRVRCAELAFHRRASLSTVHQGRVCDLRN